MEITLPFNVNLDDFEQTVTIVVYVLVGILACIILHTLYKILSCGVCLVRCLTCPCRACCSTKKDKEKEQLLGAPVTRYP